MSVVLPNYFSLDSLLYYLDSNWDNIAQIKDGRLRQSFFDLALSIREYMQQQEEKRERELFEKLKQKYEQ